jgi:hypothetical protein
VWSPAGGGNLAKILLSSGVSAPGAKERLISRSEIQFAACIALLEKRLIASRYIVYGAPQYDHL